MSNFTCYLQIFKKIANFFIKKNSIHSKKKKKLTWVRIDGSFFLQVFQVISLPIELIDLSTILLGLDSKVCYLVFHYFSSSSLFPLLFNGSFSFLKQNRHSFLSFNISLSDPQNSIFSLKFQLSLTFLKLISNHLKAKLNHNDDAPHRLYFIHHRKAGGPRTMSHHLGSSGGFFFFFFFLICVFFLDLKFVGRF